MQIHVPAYEMTKSVLIMLFSILFVLQMVACSSDKSDLAFINGKIWTGNKNQPEATSVVISGEKIVFVGKNQQAKKWIDSSTKVIDLKERLLLPGFNDAHVHFSEGGFSLIELNLREAKDRNEFALKIENYTKTLPPETWITGGNWDHEGWPEQKYPDKKLIDPVSNNHPIFVNRLDGHVAVANSLALKIAGITKNTPDPEGGFIEKDPESGEPTGILKDAAMSLVYKYVQNPPDSVRLKAIKAALQHSSELGITSVQDVSPISDYPFYEKLLAEGKLSCRINAIFPIEGYTKKYQENGVAVHSGNPMLRIGSLKCFSDGSMGAGSALFFEPYSDDPSTSGLGIYTKDKITQLIEEAHKNNLQVYTHAIGDKANRWVLDAYEKAIKKYGKKDLRHRIEHAQVVTNEDLPRFKELDVIASIQPAHCIDDMRWAEKRIGRERCRNSYMFKSFFDAGAKVAFGTDWPVAPLNPMIGLYAAVTREFPEGGPEGGWFPEEKITLEQALGAYTLGAAFAEHEDQNKGTIEVGKLADLVVLDHDLFNIPPKEILKTKVDLTVMNGQIVFERK